MPLFVVRHAKAASRSKWNGDDTERPLTRHGWAQTKALDEWLATELQALAGRGSEHRPRLVSSPFVRCMQTLEPLGARLGIVVEADDRLAEGSWFDETLELLDDLADGSVACTHGDVLPEVIAALERRGMRIDGEPDWRKAATWIVERDGDGAYVSGHAVAPPDV